MNQYEKSMELLDKFLKETPPEELQKILNIYDDLVYDGPTIDEYLAQLGGVTRLQYLQDAVKKWSDETFGKHRNGTPIAYHLKKEIDELITALKISHEGVYTSNIENGIEQMKNNKYRILMEAADCFTLLIDILAHEQLTTHELIEASYKKLEINKKRKWGKPDENGVIEHIEE